MARDIQAVFLPIDPTPLVIQTSNGPHNFTLEIADEPDERATGLMARERLSDDHGMLFVFESDRVVNMWMQNTPEPLDMLFANATGEIMHIEAMTEPFSQTIRSSGTPVRFVLELRGGLAKDLNIRVGDVMQHPQIVSP